VRLFLGWGCGLRVAGCGLRVWLAGTVQFQRGPRYTIIVSSCDLDQAEIGMKFGDDKNFKR
jgi:hypothetical protein